MWALFHQAAEREASGRDAFLDEACAGDQELRQQVAKLLAAHETGDGLLDRPPVVGLAVDEEAASSESEPSAEGELGVVLKPGEVLADRFEIVRRIGLGGMGVVYAAFDRDLEATIALKILRPEVTHAFAALDRFHSEINMARRVTHPNACRIFDLFRHGDDIVFLTMELLVGETLAERIKRDGPMSTDEALRILDQVAAALGAAHEVGVVHRDLKSGNVMLVPAGETARAVVTDFGLATTSIGDQGALELTRTGQLLGTPAFMAPEQLTGGPVTAATDVYALGLLISQMLTGRLPFDGDTPYEIAASRLHGDAPSPRRHLPDLDRQWERTILRCLERDPSDRFQTPEEVVEALRAEAVPLPPSRTRRRRRRFGLTAVAAAILLAAWLVSPQLWIGRHDERSGVGPSAAEALAFQERDWVLVTAFENRSGEELLDGTVEAALGRELANSRFVNVVPRTRISDTLRLMRRALDSHVDTELGREVALRDGGIRAVLSGRVDKMGSAYLMSVELLNPSDGIVVGSVSEEAAGEDGVLSAVRRLSNEVRRLLGEQLIDIRRSEEELAKVTTPSLHALQLYTQADLLLQASLRAEGAEELLRGAIAADPAFASAYIHLAWALYRQDRACMAECMSYSERAVELADTATDRERYFILGSHHGFREELEESEANYRALLQVDPDHYWGLGNLARNLQRVGRGEELVPLFQRRAEVAPNSFLSNAIAARYTLRLRGLEEAEPYFVRATGLEPEDGAFPQHIAYVQSYRAHKAWLEEDIDGVLEKVEEWARLRTNRPIELQKYLVGRAGSYSESVGKLRAAEEIYRQIPDDDSRMREQMLRRVELERGDQDHRKEVLQRWPIDLPAGRDTEVWLHARAGLVAEARTILDSLPDDAVVGTLRYPLRLLARGELALAEGRTQDAIPLFQEVLSIFAPWANAGYFRAGESLARAWERAGSVPNALRVLEEASAQKARALGSTLWWMEVQLHLARLYRELGREADAQEIEAELRRLLVYADPDFWMLRQLERQSGTVDAASGS